MKKRITEQQLLSLSSKALARLTDWYYGRNDCEDLQICTLWSRRGIVVPQFNIGDMLEFLYERNITPTFIPGPASQWCDTLWSVVESQLEKEDAEWEMETRCGNAGAPLLSTLSCVGNARDTITEESNMTEMTEFDRGLRAKIEAFFQEHPVDERKIWLRGRKGYLLELFRPDIITKIQNGKNVQERCAIPNCQIIYPVTFSSDEDGDRLQFFQELLTHAYYCEIEWPNYSTYCSEQKIDIEDDDGLAHENYGLYEMDTGILKQLFADLYEEFLQLVIDHYHQAY